MLLSDLLKPVGIISSNTEKLNEKSIPIHKLAYHSSEVEEGTLFVCITGYRTDGHKFAEAALLKGATALIVERFLPELDIPQYKVENSRKALAKISSVFFDRPSERMSVFGVTGTNGKTTITYMTDCIFRADKLETGLIGTVMIKNRDKKTPSVLTTPESLDLQGYLSDMQTAGVSHVSMEVSSSALELQRVADVDFDVVAFTNINKDHIELHGSFDAYFSAKASLIRKASSSSIAVINGDEPLLTSLVNETEAQVVTFGINNTEADVTVTDVQLLAGRPSFTVNINTPLTTLGGNTLAPISFPVDLNVPGQHSIYNALTAIIVGLANDLSVSTVKSGIESFEGVERRFHILYDEEFMIVDDLFLNENNIESSMRTLESLTYQSIKIVHAIRGSNGSKLNRENATKMAQWFRKLSIDKMILTASRSHVKTKDQVSQEELNAFLDVMADFEIDVEYYDELEQALSSSLKKIEQGDLMLITGARGMDYGAKTLLDLLKKNKPESSRRIIQEVLNKKMVGMDDLSLTDSSA